MSLLKGKEPGVVKFKETFIYGKDIDRESSFLFLAFTGVSRSVLDTELL